MTSPGLVWPCGLRDSGATPRHLLPLPGDGVQMASELLSPTTEIMFSYFPLT
ncbi:hypothetical protein E2C01_028427 [Portunus trituberculatus]|uniref:Uncharacterized protein n=1 Tax=Portunus trituberculatus TaxID=210409 RepID=A0A5B7EKF3_PORTR|nr:hypothetical protein [Portunus trituberculatus]